MATYIPRTGRYFNLVKDLDLQADAMQNIPFSEAKQDIVEGTKNLGRGFVKENLIALTISKTLSGKSFDREENYNPYNDPQLIGLLGEMSYFVGSKSREETSHRIKEFYQEQRKYYQSPMYWVGRIVGGLSDPVSAALFTPYGKVLLTGSRMARSGKFGGAIASEEFLKQNIDPTRTTGEGVLITGAGFVLPMVFPGLNKIPQSKNAFKNSDQKMKFADDVDDVENTKFKLTEKELKAQDESTFGGASAGAAEVNKILAAKEEARILEIADTGFGWLGEKLPITPFFRTLKASVINAKRSVLGLGENPLLLKANFKDMSTDSRSVERLIALERYRIFDSETEILNLYTQYLERMGIAKKKVFKDLRNRLTKTEGDILGWDDFQKAIIYKRLGVSRKGTELDEVTKAADVSQKYIYSLADQWADLRISQKYIEYHLDKVTKRLKKVKAKSIKTKADNIEIKSLEGQMAKLQDKLKYLDEKGPLAKNYVNRVWKRDAIAARIDEFMQIIKPMIKRNHPKMSDKEIDDMIFNMQNSQPYVRFDKMDNNDMAISKSFHERELRFTKEDDALLVDAGFVETDFLALQRLYYNSVVPDLKLTEKFGDPMMSGRWMEEGMLPGLKQISEEYNELIKKAKSNTYKTKLKNEKIAVIKDLKAMRDLQRGTYGLPSDPQRSLSRGIRMLKLYNSVTMLTGALAAVPDVARILMTSGINRGFRTSWDLFTNYLATDIAKRSHRMTLLSGEAADMILGSRAMSMYDLDNAFGVFNKMEKGVSKMGNMYFTYINLMNPWNTFVKSWAGAVNGTRIIEEVENWIVKGKISKLNKTKLLSVGIDEKNAKKIWNQYTKHGSGKGGLEAEWKHVRIANTADWDDIDAAQLFNSALGKDVNITIVTPSKGDVPLWFNEEWGGVIVQFKKFAMGATQRMLIRGMQERDMNFLGGIVMLMAAGAIVDATRTKAFNRDYSKKKWGEKVVNAFDRSGLGGVFSDMNNILERMTNNKIGLRPVLGAKRPYGSYTQKNIMSGFGVLGPTSSQIGTISDIMWDWGTGKHNHYTARNVRRLIPFQNVWYLDSLFDQVEKGLR